MLSLSFFNPFLQQAALPQGISSITQDSSVVVDKLIDLVFSLGERILIALVIFIIGRFLISMANKLVGRVLDRRRIDKEVKSFLKSLVKIVLVIMLIITIVGSLGINITSFAALLASAGVAIGMALSGNLQNFAGGIIILLFKPFKIGDFVDCQGVSGTVKDIQIFHTILLDTSNKTVYVPNGALSSGVVVNYSQQNIRRIEWIVGVDYGVDFPKVEQTVREIISAEERVLPAPEPLIALHALDSSSVNVVIRVWVPSEAYWEVYFGMNQRIYAVFNEKGINFPFPQLTVHTVS